jgi:hypothetical protein
MAGKERAVLGIYPYSSVENAVERTDAQDISSTGEADYVRSDKPLPRSTGGGGTT